MTSIGSRLDELRRIRLPDAAHTSRPWAIHALTPDFELEDVWALPTPGGPDDMSMLVAMFTGGELRGSSSRASRALFAIRFKVGELLGWDRRPADGGAERSLRTRLAPGPVNDGETSQRGWPDSPSSGENPAATADGSPFTTVYLSEHEYAAEIINRTVHAVLHLAWVPDGDGGYRGQMAVLVKPNGLLGRAYMAAIKPFRYLIVYPALIRQIGRTWEERAGAPVDAVDRHTVATG
jgi:Protein of unknown function (DUF2867)